MISFEKLNLNQKTKYDSYLMSGPERGCEYSFVNLFLWGRQKAAFRGGRLLLFSQFNRHNVYPFPLGDGDLKRVLDAIIRDSAQRGIPCCLTGLLKEECDQVEALYPGAFRFYPDRDSFDYVYSVDDLADLKGRKFQKKRNHLHRFEDAHPNAQVLPLDEHTRVAAYCMLRKWYADRKASDPHTDFHLEELAMNRAFTFRKQLGLEGLVLVDDGQILAFTMGSRLNADTFDIHFEKARENVDGAYPAINRAFARYLREKYPDVRFLNREDDMGLEGLRKAKLSYNPHHMVEKYWARLWEEEDEH